MKRIVKIDAPVEPSEKQEAKSLGLDLLHILEVEVSAESDDDDDDDDDDDQYCCCLYFGPNVQAIILIYNI